MFNGTLQQPRPFAGTSPASASSTDSTATITSRESNYTHIYSLLPNKVLEPLSLHAVLKQFEFSSGRSRCVFLVGSETRVIDVIYTQRKLIGNALRPVC